MVLWNSSQEYGKYVYNLQCRNTLDTAPSIFTRILLHEYHQLPANDQ